MQGSKKLTLFQALSIGLGNIIGAGIFIMAGASITAAGPAAILAFLITAFYATTVGISNAELSSDFPSVEGGVYSFTLLTMGETLGFLVGWFRLIAYSISGAATALGFSGYLISIGLPKILYFPIAAFLILILVIIDYLGLRLAAVIESSLVVLNILGLLLFSFSSLFISGIKVGNFTPFLPHGILGVLVASNIAFFAYSGFNTIATLTPNVENGEKTVPKAIIFSLIISASLYMLVTFSMVDSLYWNKFGTASDPLSLVLSSIRAPSYLIYFIDLTAIIATITVTLSIIIAGERTLSQMVKDSMLPKILGGKKTTLLIISAIMIASLSLGNVESIALASNFGIVFSYMLSGIQVAIARKRKIKGKFRSPLYPFLQIFSVILSALFMASLGENALVIGVVTLIVGLVVFSLHKEFIKEFESRRAIR
ncbi:APC family permease [Acidianus brierleyi]|uniref:Amino acid transporter n=1 Tax=Acidianus brierleyi TaxID=41673 RepID=A0A2U9IC94_9CREN|nr:amino acid permease [Acidianus brierleyi]AWR93627.1 amino acid permease [Acidianus brierleyi]